MILLYSRGIQGGKENVFCELQSNKASRNILNQICRSQTQFVIVILDL